jgi:hypothetical protein
VKAAKKPGNDASATKDVKIWETLKLQMAALERAAREGEFDGKDGITPHIGENGNWYLGETDTGVKARGEDGDTPYVGANGNWFVGGKDTGLPSRGEKGDPGSDASVTAENIEAALGYTPADTDVVPTKVSDIENDVGYITRQAADLLNYYKKSESYNKTEVDEFLASLAQTLNSIADSDDTTLDQLSEIVAYIKANKSLIDVITTSKVNVSDIIDNLETGNAVKPLSANMGKQLKALLDALESEVGTAKSQAQTAQMLASRADTAAGSASSAAQSAQGTAEGAFQKAQTAQGTAEGAFQKAQSAYSMADSAYQKAQTAQGTAEGAFQKAQTAQETAEEALQKAGTGGGTGAPEVHIGAGAPTGSETLWVDTDDNSGAAESEDMYVPIDFVTMTNAVQSLSISREPDGTLYRFKAVMVKMQKPATTAGYTLQCYTYHANGKGLRMVLNFNSASAMGARIENYPRRGYFTGGGYAPSVAYSNSGTAIALPNASEAAIQSDQPITSLYFLAYGDAVIPAGSTFEIWGVRA